MNILNYIICSYNLDRSELNLPSDDGIGFLGFVASIVVCIVIYCILNSDGNTGKRYPNDSDNV